MTLWLLLLEVVHCFLWYSHVNTKLVQQAQVDVLPHARTQILECPLRHLLFQRSDGRDPVGAIIKHKEKVKQSIAAKGSVLFFTIILLITVER